MNELVKMVRASFGEKGVISKADFEEIVRKVSESPEGAAAGVLGDEWSESFIAFVRQEGVRATTVAMLTVWSPLAGPDEIVKAIKNGMGRWVVTSERGKQAWEETCQDLNVGDLLGQGYSQDRALAAILREECVVIAEGVITDWNEAWSYDTVLVSISEAAAEETS
jgi:hypothetical protein